MAVSGAAAAAIANAIKSSGIIVHLDPVEFQNILHKIERPLVVCAVGGIFSRNYQYLVSYKGLAFFTKTSEELAFPKGAEIIMTKKIWVP